MARTTQILHSNSSMMNGTLKIDMRDIIAQQYRYGKKMHGGLSFNGHELASCKLNPKCMDLIYRTKIAGFWKYINQEVPGV